MIAILVTIFIGISSVEASQCLEGVDYYIPVGIDDEYPVNMLPVFWYGIDSDPNNYPFELFKTETGELVPLTIEPLDDYSYRFVPDENLENYTEYQFYNGSFDLHFNTNARVDTNAPNPPEFGGVMRIEEESELGLSTFLVASLSRTYSSSIDLNQHYFRIEVSDNSDFENPIVVWRPGKKHYLSGVMTIELTLGYSPCVAQLSQEEVTSVQFLRIQSIDLSGNISEYSEAQNIADDEPVEVIDEHEGEYEEGEPTSDENSDAKTGCHAVEAGFSSWALLSALFAIRRRRKTI